VLAWVSARNGFLESAHRLVGGLDAPCAGKMPALPCFGRFAAKGQLHRSGLEDVAPAAAKMASQILERIPTGPVL